MESHPVPQNVTSFQFHLVGDMTLKQFLYLAVGAAIAYFIFVFLVVSYPLIAWPAIIISVSLGVAFAFLPIASRPLDYWLGAFLKAIYSPTKRVWNKNGKIYKEDSLFNSRLIMYLSSLKPKPVEPPATLVTPPLEAKLPTEPQAISELPSSEELKKTVDLAREAQNLQFRIVQTERTLGQIKSQAQGVTQPNIDYNQEINKVMADLQGLINKTSQIKAELDKVTKPEQKQLTPISPLHLREKIKVVIPTKPKQTQVALTTFPNVLNGIVKDTTNNYLDGVVVVIYDKEGLPVRALKTNKLGQFSGSTPLPNGTYTLELEKDNFSFDVLQIELSGELLPPLLITAK